ncbi:hypothetical protein OAT84_03105 [Gammaproteobacteria bacterium]|nr:hypothetical protein [Gammaproteobacteria bacterium]
MHKELMAFFEGERSKWLNSDQRMKLQPTPVHGFVKKVIFNQDRVKSLEVLEFQFSCPKVLSLGRLIKHIQQSWLLENLL